MDSENSTISDDEGLSSTEPIINEHESEPERELSDSESVELDVREAYEELKNGAEPSESEPRTEKKADSSPKDDQEAGDVVEDTPPPATWKADAKEWFNQQSPVAKRELARRVTQIERDANELMREYAGYRKEYEELNQALSPYETAWQARGMSKAQAVQQLLAMDKYLNDDLAKGLDLLARSRGTTLQDVAYALENGEQVQPPQLGQPQNDNLQALQQQVQFLLDRDRYSTMAEDSRQAESELAELHAVRDEQDGTGRYIRPEMHDDDFVRERLGPLYQSLRQQPQNQGRSATELVKLAYQAVTGSNPVAQQPQAPAAQTQSSVNRDALSSVRGSPVATPKATLEDVPDNVEDSMRQIARELGMTE
jgi:hypothetical protein